MSFGAGRGPSQAWALLLGLAGYTLLLATTACVLIRLGKMWDDLRSLLLLIVIMFLAIAMNCDDGMAADPSTGAPRYIGGLVFAVVVTESVLRTIRLRLPGWYRAAYYLILGLVFLYPLALAPLLGDPDRPALRWALFGFSPLAALTVTALVPAARRGAALVAKNGSPWRWPLYPWSLFLVMVIGLGVRACSLCVSFQYVPGRGTIFGPYFLAPIGLAVSLVWLEIGVAARRRDVMVAACALPLFLAYATTFGDQKDVVYRHFLVMVTDTLGSPFFLALCGSILFLGYAAARRVPLVRELLAVNLAALAVVGPRSVDLDHLVAAHPVPLLAASLVLGAEALARRSSARGALAAALLAAGMIRGVSELWPGAPLETVAFHLGILAALAVGAIFDDALGRFMRRCGAIILLLAGVSAASGYPHVWASLPRQVSNWYPLLVAFVAYAFGYLTRERVYIASAAVSSSAWLASCGTQGYSQLRKLVAGLDQISWGMLFFAVAMAISLRKAGLWPRRATREVRRLLWLRRGQGAAQE
jgi:hypothetical protein